MASFRKLQQNLEDLFNRLAEFSGLKTDIVRNIFYYAKCLVQHGATGIDDLIFSAQMSDQFNITGTYILDLMFSALKKYGDNTIPVEDYCKYICTIMGNNLDSKIDLVFSFYDANGDGGLSFYELYMLLRPCIVAHDDEDSEASVKDLVTCVMQLLDLDKNGSIEKEEFRQLVKKDILYLQILGPCLPTDVRIQHFISRLEDKTPTQIQVMFRHERRRSLKELEPEVETTGLYPIPLEIP